MADFSNSKKLAAVVGYWARPVISQLVSSRICKMDFFQSVQNSMIGNGLVGAGYHINSDMEPLLLPAISAVVEPLLTRQLERVPDEAIPQMAHDVIDEMIKKGEYTLMDGVITFEKEDLDELKQLLQKNLPLPQKENYEVIV